MRCLHHTSIWRLHGPFKRLVPRSIVVRNNFREGLDIIRIRIRHLKGENKYESSGSHHSSELDIEGLKIAQRYKLVAVRIIAVVF